MTPRRGHLRATTAVLVAGLPLAALLTASQAPSASAESDATTVAAPGAGDGATVTVSKTDGLVNEAVRVSWTGFRSSSSTQLANSNGYDLQTENPVRVYQCRGADPDSSSDCYGAPGFAGAPATGDVAEVPAVPGFTYAGQTSPYANAPDGPANFQDTVSSANGSGSVTIPLFTRKEAVSLGCAPSAPCSIVVVPNYGRSINGGNPVGATEDMIDAPWSWDRRTVVPVEFADLDIDCPLADAGVLVEGSPMTARALRSWRAGACTGDRALTVDYTAINEPQTRNDVVQGVSDVGLVTRPAEASTTTKAGLVYAPVAISGVVVAFQIDDSKGQPVRQLRLNERLVAKLITASYRIGQNKNTLGNPTSIFNDPEFLRLNPGVSWPRGTAGNHVVLLGDLSDTTWEITRWIQADAAARAFLAGKADPDGMHVNLAYQGLDLPITSFPVLDENQADDFAPIQGLDHVAHQVSNAQFPGGIIAMDEGGRPVKSVYPRQNPGNRQVIGIMDAAQARAFRLDTAQLPDARGSFVPPDDDGFRSALPAMTSGADGVTRSVDPAKIAGYPLTTVTVAVTRRSVTGDAKRGVLAFLDYVAGPGQEPGDAAGELPDGYVPLTSAMLAQVSAARAAVVAGPTPAPSASPSPSTSPDGAPTDPDFPTTTGSGDIPTSSSDPTQQPDGTAATPAATTASDGALVAAAAVTPVPLVTRVLVPLAVVGALAVLLAPLLWWLGDHRVRLWVRR